MSFTSAANHANHPVVQHAAGTQPEREEQNLQAPSAESAASGEAAIAAANQELRRRSDEHLALPIVILIEQRDRALQALHQVESAASEQRAALVAEQDGFITFLMEEQEKKLRTLEGDLAAARKELERREALASTRLAPSELSAGDGRVVQALEEAQTQIVVVQEQLASAYEEVDEARRDACRLQEERDEAVRAIEEARASAYLELQASREQAFDLQAQLDEASRCLEDARDEARDEAYRLTEALDVVRRELDERKEEVRRLRGRLAQTEAPLHSRPPPPPASQELEVARDETQSLRKQLIDTKRELSRAMREIETLRQTARRTVSHPGFAAVQPQARGDGSPSNPRDGEPQRRMTPRGIGAPERD
jgi:uncharacterized coiled-coil DUF342 family protein